MNKYEVIQQNGLVIILQADYFEYQGEYVEFFETIGGFTPNAGDTNLATLPTRRLLTVLHRPLEVTPVYDE